MWQPFNVSSPREFLKLPHRARLCSSTSTTSPQGAQRKKRRGRTPQSAPKTKSLEQRTPCSGKSPSFSDQYHQLPSRQRLGPCLAARKSKVALSTESKVMISISFISEYDNGLRLCMRHKTMKLDSSLWTFRFMSKRRLLLISAPSEDDYSFQQQLTALNGQQCDLGESTLHYTLNVWIKMS